MASSRSKVFSGPEFSGSEELSFSDINNWVIEGRSGESAKIALDDFDWNGKAVMGVILETTPDNKKVSNGSIFLTGEYMRNPKEIKANRLFLEAERDLRMSYLIEDAGVFTFNAGTLVGDYINDDRITWSVVRKTNRGQVEEVEEASYGEHNIGNFCLRPFVVPLSPKTARVTIMAYPLKKEELEAQYSLCGDPAFPGLELMVCEVDMFPMASPDTSKAWGCPLVPLLLLAGDQEEHANIPPTGDIKAAISAILRTAVCPTTKRDLRTLSATWTSILESGPSKLKQKAPECLWPLWTRENPRQQGRKHIT